MTQDPFIPLGLNNRRRPHGLMAPVVWLAGVIAAAAAMAVGAILALFTAVAVVVIAVVAGVLVFFTGLAMRARRTVTVRARRSDDVIEARQVNGEWVAYGWEQQGR